MVTIVGFALLTSALLFSPESAAGPGTRPSAAVESGADAPEPSAACPAAAKPTLESEVERGDCLRARGELALAVEAYQEALNHKSIKEPKIPGRVGSRALYYGLGLAYEDMGNIEGSLDAFIAASRFMPADADLLYHRGIAKEQLGEFAGALTDFRTAVQLDPQHGPAHRNIGFILGEQDRLDEGVVELKEAIRINPSDWKANLNLGTAYSRIFDSIVKELKEFPMTSPPKPGEKDPFAERQLELVKKYHSFDWQQAALSAYREAARANPKTIVTWNNLALQAAKMGKHADAIEAYQHAAELDPRDPKPQRGLAHALGQAKRYREAREVAEKALALSGGTDPWTAQYLGTLDTELGDYARAEARFKELLKRDPDEPMSHLGLARIYRRQQKTAESLEELKIAQRLRPDQSQQFQQMLERDSD